MRFHKEQAERYERRIEGHWLLDAFQEPNRPVIAKCRACGFEMHGPLLRVATGTGHPCTKCGALGTFALRDKEEQQNDSV